MKRMQILVFVMIILIISSLFIIATTDLFNFKEEKEVYDISVIINESEADGWSGFRSGMDQAAKEMNANVSFISLYDRNSLAQQMVLLRREIDDGADAILIAPADSKRFRERLSNMEVNIPIIILGPTSKEEGVNIYISPDNIGMGKALAEEIIQHGREKETILIIKNGMECDSLAKRYEGLLEVLNSGDMTYHVLDLDETDEKDTLGDRINTELRTRYTDVVVTLDEIILEYTLNEMEVLQIAGKRKVYGFGYTNRIVYNIETDIVNAVAVQNMYKSGYLGIKNAVEAIGEKNIVKTILIDSTIINGNNMYEQDNQTWLFPIL